MPTTEFDAFDALVRKVMAVPHETIKQRVDEHRERALRNPNRPGPKPKVNPSASDPADQPDRA